MCRGLAVLLAIFAQGMALMSPVSFVRCMRADGEQRVELSAIGCDCHDCPSEHDHTAADLSHDCEHHHDDCCQHETELVIAQLTCGDCGCTHSAVQFVPQVRSRTGNDMTQFAPTVPAVAFVDVELAWRRHCCVDRRPLADRVSHSPHLVTTSVVVLRV